MLEFAEDQGDQEITPAILHSTFMDPKDLADQVENYREIDDQIYTALTQLCEGEGLDIVRNISTKSGTEAWRRLVKRYDPTTVNRRRALMTSILSPGTFKLTELSAAIEKWEESVRQFERRKNSTGERKAMDDEIKSGILQQMCPDSLRNHLYLNASRFKSYIDVRTEIISYLEAMNTAGAPGSPMDVGSMYRSAEGWKGKGSKGKSGKGFKGKQDKGKGKGGEHKGSKGTKGGKTANGFGTSKGGKSYEKSYWNKGEAGKARKGDGGKGKSACWNCGSPNHWSSNCPHSKGSSSSRIGCVDHDGCSDGWWQNQQWQQSEPQQEQQSSQGKPDSLVQGLDLLGFMYDRSSGRARWVKDDANVSMHKMTFTMDSGAAVSGIPVEECNDLGLPRESDQQTGTTYRAANGQGVQDEGKVKAEVINEKGVWKRLTARAIPISKPIASAAKICKAGHEIVLNSQGGIIRNTYTGDITPLRIERDVFVFDVWVLPNHTPPRYQHDRTRALGPLHEPSTTTGSSGSSHQPQDFPRRVRWP